MIVLFGFLTVFGIVFVIICTKNVIKKRACSCEVELTKIERVITSEEFVYPVQVANSPLEATELTSLSSPAACSYSNRSDQMWFVDLETPKECYRKTILPFLEASPTSSLANQQCTYKKFPSPISNRTLPSIDFSSNIVYYGESETLV
ncbi:unnamed protein product [Auanema sp. JU1783]|nr:unnamed protein product [Auanema sp. JU1783]